MISKAVVFRDPKQPAIDKQMTSSNRIYTNVKTKLKLYFKSQGISDRSVVLLNMRESLPKLEIRS